MLRTSFAKYPESFHSCSAQMYVHIFHKDVKKDRILQTQPDTVGCTVSSCTKLWWSRVLVEPKARLQLLRPCMIKLLIGTVWLCTNINLLLYVRVAGTMLKSWHQNTNPGISFWLMWEAPLLFWKSLGLKKKKKKKNEGMNSGTIKRKQHANDKGGKKRSKIIFKRRSWGKTAAKTRHWSPSERAEQLFFSVMATGKKT